MSSLVCDPDPPTEIDTLLNRGAYLRSLRLQVDPPTSEPGSETLASTSHFTPEGYLIYDSFLSNQVCYDDLKHADHPGISFSFGSDGTKTVNIEQTKALKKAGWVWDAAFILTEYLLATLPPPSISLPCKIIELGAGTGILTATLLTASHDVYATDLPDVVPLIRSNLSRNGLPPSHAFPLTWGLDDPEHESRYDAVVGADIVASLYSPESLARTIHRVLRPGGRGYLSYRRREDEYHDRFEMKMRGIFEGVEVERWVGGRNRNPEVRILRFWGKMDVEFGDGVDVGGDVRGDEGGSGEG